MLLLSWMHLPPDAADERLAADLARLRTHFPDRAYLALTGSAPASMSGWRR